METEFVQWCVRYEDEEDVYVRLYTNKRNAKKDYRAAKQLGFKNVTIYNLD